jgi:Ser/Thr protein kinase RdoA (MazF antagonist)
LWNADFAPNSADGIAVPEPVGVIPQFQMWLQRKVPGASATELLVKSGGTTLARRIATAVHKLHQAGIPSHRRHTMADELRILHERLPLVAQIKPQWTGRLEKLLEACNQLGAATPTPNFRGIHRDFYPDQVIVDGERLYFLDFDLYCQGDPGLDIGNFLGHLKEQSLRTLGDSEALADRETALTEQFVQLSGETTEVAISAYTMLTLVRHVYLSTQFSERRQFTEALLELCEQRLMS